MLLLQLNENDQNTKSSILTFKQASSNIFHLPGVKCTFIILTFKKVARQNYICIIKSPGQITFDCKDYLKNAFGYIHFYRVLVFVCYVLHAHCLINFLQLLNQSQQSNLLLGTLSIFSIIVNYIFRRILRLIYHIIMTLQYSKW